MERPGLEQKGVEKRLKYSTDLNNKSPVYTSAVVLTIEWLNIHCVILGVPLEKNKNPKSRLPGNWFDLTIVVVFSYVSCLILSLTKKMLVVANYVTKKCCIFYAILIDRVVGVNNMCQTNKVEKLICVV